MASKLTICTTSIVYLLLAACGGGGGGDGGGDTSGTQPPPNQPPPNQPPPDQPPPDPPPTAAIGGFDFDFEQGDFWEYQWDYYESSFAMGSGGSSKTRRGRFRVTLGESVLIQGIEAFEVLVSGRNKVENEEFAPRWRYLAISDNNILGGESAASLETIFDAQTGNWAGGGFFAALPAQTLIEATEGSINNDYIEDACLVVEQSSSQDKCENFPGVGLICGDESYSHREREYYKAEVGPIGYYYYRAFEDCGGGFCSGGSWEYNVGLVHSSMLGDNLDYDLEVEPNNSMAEATTIDWNRGFWGDLIDEADYGAATPFVANSVAESSNDSPRQPQLVDTPTVVNADVLVSDNGEHLEIRDFFGAGNNYSETVEDWYYFRLRESQTLRFVLDFPGSTDADLDILVIQDSEPPDQILAVPDVLMGYSVDDNAATGVAAEELVLDLPAGSFWIAMDGYSTPSGRVSYTLNVDDRDNPSNSISITDWAAFTLSSQTGLTIEAVGGPSIALIDANGSNLIGSAMGEDAGLPTRVTTDLLGAGSYYLGLGQSQNSDSTYEVSITPQ